MDLGLQDGLLRDLDTTVTQPDEVATSYYYRSTYCRRNDGREGGLDGISKDLVVFVGGLGSFTFDPKSRSIGSAFGKFVQKEEFLRGPGHRKTPLVATEMDNGLVEYSTIAIRAQLSVRVCPKSHRARFSLGARLYKIRSLPLDDPGKTTSKPISVPVTNPGCFWLLNAVNLSGIRGSARWLSIASIETALCIGWISTVTLYIHESLGLAINTLVNLSYPSWCSLTTVGETNGSLASLVFSKNEFKRDQNRILDARHTDENTAQTDVLRL
jgi:hypothetical protein